MPRFAPKERETRFLHLEGQGEATTAMPTATGIFWSCLTIPFNATRKQKPASSVIRGISYKGVCLFGNASPMEFRRFLQPETGGGSGWVCAVPEVLMVVGGVPLRACQAPGRQDESGQWGAWL